MWQTASCIEINYIASLSHIYLFKYMAFEVFNLRSANQLNYLQIYIFLYV